MPSVAGIAAVLLVDHIFKLENAILMRSGCDRANVISNNNVFMKKSMFTLTTTRKNTIVLGRYATDNVIEFSGFSIIYEPLNTINYHYLRVYTL